MSFVAKNSCNKVIKRDIMFSIGGENTVLNHKATNGALEHIKEK